MGMDRNAPPCAAEALARVMFEAARLPNSPRAMEIDLDAEGRAQIERLAEETMRQLERIEVESAARLRECNGAGRAMVVDVAVIRRHQKPQRLS